MILVTVGTEQYQFNRLMRWIQILIDRGFVNPQELLVQYGHCSFWPSNVNSVSLLSRNRFEEYVFQSSLIISHCGEGTLLLLETVHKPYILVPRCSALGEHVDDHQIELALALEQLHMPIAWSTGDLVRFLASPRWISPATFSITEFCQELNHRYSSSSQ
ncbi:MAG TPA: glycosyltransferase [Stenomitos sp.]